MILANKKPSLLDCYAKGIGVLTVQNCLLKTWAKKDSKKKRNNYTEAIFTHEVKNR